MSEYSPIIYLISAIGAEVVKDVAKHLGKTVYEKTIASFKEPIIDLGINDYSNFREIDEKLETEPEIKSEIETKIRENNEELKKILQFLAKNPNYIIERISIKGDDNVSNFGTYYDHRNSNKSNSLTYILVFLCFLVFAIVVLFFYVKNQTPIFINSNSNQTSNSQSNAIAQNVNVNAGNSNQGRTPKPSQQSNGSSPRPKGKNVKPNPNHTPEERTLESSN